MIMIFLKTCLIKIKTKTEMDWKHTFEKKWREKIMKNLFKMKQWNISKNETLEKNLNIKKIPWS